MGDRSVDGARFAFDEDVWFEEVGRLRAGGRARVQAAAARAQIQRPGARIPVRACDTEGPDGSHLAACAKVYVPIGVEPSRAPHGLVFAIGTRPDSARLVLRFVAYGERHPRSGRSVYERAHRRLHGRFPGQ